MMKTIMNKLPLLLLACVSGGVLLEFILCFIRSYPELWYTILIFGLVALIPSLLGLVFKNGMLNVISGIVLIILAILMLAFPNYLMIVIFVMGTLAFLGGVFSLIMRFLPNKKDENC